VIAPNLHLAHQQMEITHSAIDRHGTPVNGIPLVRLNLNPQQFADGNGEKQAGGNMLLWPEPLAAGRTAAAAPDLTSDAEIVRNNADA